jgi:hypothetical protein
MRQLSSKIILSTILPPNSEAKVVLNLTSEFGRSTPRIQAVKADLYNHEQDDSVNED